jgi:glyoxylase-like metal-dependent hydrolase (beta-lactamase superfamily II)
MRKLLYSIHSNAQKLDGGAMFGNAPKALWERWIPADKLNRIDLSCRCLLVKDGNKRILFEAGIGSFLSPKYRERYGVQGSKNQLIKNLERLGLSDTDIDIVVLSHLHFDHAGGLLSSYKEETPLALLFPNAQYLVSKLHWERACEPHSRDKASFIPELQGLLQNSGRLTLINGSHSDLLGKDYCFHFSHGHTPGLMLTEMSSEQGPILFASDLIPGRAWVHRSITMGYDRFPEQLIDEKIKLLSRLVMSNGRLFFTHDTSTALSRVVRNDSGKFSTVNNLPHLQAFEI